MTETERDGKEFSVGLFANTGERLNKANLPDEVEHNPDCSKFDWVAKLD